MQRAVKTRVPGLPCDENCMILWSLVLSHASVYGSDCWAMSRTDARKIDALDQWCLRMLLGIRWYQFYGMMMYGG